MFCTLSVVSGQKNDAWKVGQRNDYANTTIKVLLDRCAQRLDLQYLSVDPIEVRGDNRVTLLAAKRLQLLWLAKNSLQLNGQRVEAGVIQLVPPSPSTTVRYASRIYRGSLWVYPDTKGMMVVNELPIEEYLVGTLAGEMSPSWELEALKAQAVASRSFAAYCKRHPRSTRYHVDSTVKDQVFVGSAIESAQLLAAVRATTGLLLTLNAQPLQAFFHSRCGGVTQDAEAVWSHSPKGAMVSVNCPYCYRNPVRWQIDIAHNDLRKAFGFPQVASQSPPFGLSADRRLSGRIQSITMTEQGKKVTIAADKLRAKVGYGRLKSAVFDWQRKPATTTFFGTGFGHGVGLCQWGARYLAQQGKTFREILVYYYPKAEIK